MILEDRFEELGELELCSVNGGTCTGGGCTSGGYSSGYTGGSLSGSCTSVSYVGGSCTSASYTTGSCTTTGNGVSRITLSTGGCTKANSKIDDNQKQIMKHTDDEIASSGETVDIEIKSDLSKSNETSESTENISTETPKKKTAFEKMLASINENSKKEYNKDNSGYKCDNWVEEVLTDAGFTASDYLTAGKASEKTVQQHIDALKKSSNDYTTTIPTENGVYVVFMNDGHIVDGKQYSPHAGLLIIGDNNPYFMDNSSGNENHGVEKTYGDTTASSVMNKYGYDSFYYQKVN